MGVIRELRGGNVFGRNQKTLYSVVMVFSMVVVLAQVLLTGCASTSKSGTARRSECQQTSARLDALRVRAETGRVDADEQYRLGEWNASGVCIPKDDETALRWYQQAAAQGNSKALYAVGEAYRNGWGVAQDDFEAMKWYRRAAETGHKVARESYEALVTQNVPQLLKVAQLQLADLGQLAVVQRWRDGRGKLGKPRGSPASVTGRLGLSGMLIGYFLAYSSPIGAVVYGGLTAAGATKSGIEHGRAGRAIHEELASLFSQVDLGQILVAQMQAILAEAELETTPPVVLLASSADREPVSMSTRVDAQAATIVQLTFEEASLENITAAWKWEATNQPGLVLSLRTNARASRISDAQLLFEERVEYKGYRTLSWQEKPFREEVTRAARHLAGRILLRLVQSDGILVGP